ncbi:MIF4G domain-containing protein [Babesia ovis]|uniref:MIF4G domain-containing protein n=1 Tax=Babesia ovis TaxID=5869 RepID=A0A9W5TC62_BABOV|nr:MIF4G domain-containing protein [Babesia ovis]
MATGHEESNDSQVVKPKTTFNPDAPEFNPSQIRSSGKLNADAPEFIPGQLGTFDGGLGYVSITDVKHGRRYNRGAYPRPASQMYPPGMQYPPRWPQQYVPMWVSYPSEAEHGNVPYDFQPYGYGRRRGSDGPPRQGRIPKPGPPDPDVQKNREPRTPHGTGSQTTPTAYPRYAYKPEGMMTSIVTQGDNQMPHVVPSGEPIPLPVTTPPHNANDGSLTWADRFRLSQAEVKEPEAVKREEPPQPAPTWNGRPTFAEMMRKAKEHPDVPMMPSDMIQGELREAGHESAVNTPVHTHDTDQRGGNMATPVRANVHQTYGSGSQGDEHMVDDPKEDNKLRGTTGEHGSHKQYVKPVDFAVKGAVGVHETSPFVNNLNPSEKVSVGAVIVEKAPTADSKNAVVASNVNHISVQKLETSEQRHSVHVTNAEHVTLISQGESFAPKGVEAGKERDVATHVEESSETAMARTSVDAASKGTDEAKVLYRDVAGVDGTVKGATVDPKEQKAAEQAKSMLPNDGIYSVEQLISCGFEMKKHNIEEKLHWGFTAYIQETKSNNDYRRNDYDRGNNARARGDNWSGQKRSNRSEAKGFRSSSKSLEFSRDQLEAVSLPQASESSWIIKQAKLKMDKEQQLLRKLMGLLNRLTVEKFDTIYKQVLNSGVETYDQAFVLVKIIFEKAITQHHFIPMYVELCGKLCYDLDNFTCKDQPEDPQQEGGSDTSKQEQRGTRKSDFMRILLNCCQDSFENNLKPLEFPPDLEGDDKFEFELKYKHRMRGNMIFVGELFKQKLLAAKLLIICLDQVFAKRNECIAATGRIETGDNHLEGMCTLLQTVGKCFDTDKWKYSGEFEKHIQMLTDLGRNPNICFRIRCLIQNVLDSRHGNWTITTPYKAEAPSRLQDLRTKVMEQEKQQEENAWKFRRRAKAPESNRSPSPRSSPPPNVLANPVVIGTVSSEEIKRRARGIVKELVMSHDHTEATLCVTEMNLCPTQDMELYAHIFNAALEACAKITADDERRLVAKWVSELAIERSSQEALVKWMYGFVKDEPVEHGYSMMVEDYPVVPLLLKELLGSMKQSYTEVPGFDEVSKIIENEIYPNAGMIA